jgi:putative transposase
VPIPEKYKAPFCAGNYYHLLFRSIDGLSLFQDRKDYLLFLRQYAKYFQPVVHTLAYNLLENHSHLVVQVKDRKSLHQDLSSLTGKFRTSIMRKALSELANDYLINEMIERQANSFMASYVNLKNHDTGRKGGLFQSPFRRSFINDDAHLQQAIIYVHANAQKHGIVKDYRHHHYSSYHEILSGYSPNIDVPQVLEFFGGRDRFIQIHEKQVEHFYTNEWRSSYLEIKK